MPRVEIPAPGDLVMDESGNVRSDVAATLTLAADRVGGVLGTGSDVTHYSALTGGSSATGGLKSGADGTIVDSGGNRRYVDSGLTMDLTIDGRSRQVESLSASVESDVAGAINKLGRHVKDSGAVGDGTANDTAALNTAASDASAYAIANPVPGPHGLVPGQVRLQFHDKADETYLTDSFHVQPHVHYDFGTATLVKRTNGGSTATNSLVLAPLTETPSGSGGTGTTVNGSNQITALSNVSAFSIGRKISGTGIPAGAWVEGIDVATSSLSLSIPATASNTGVAVTLAATYYETYKNMTFSGGKFTLDGHAAPGHIFNLDWLQDCKIIGPEVEHDPANDTWAFAIAGRDLKLDGLIVRNGTVIHQDGLHILHGQRIEINGGSFQSGDDCISLGTEPAYAPYTTEPDPLRDVTIRGALLSSAAVSCIKIYVQTGAPDTSDWEVTDVTITGVEGGSQDNAPIVIRDYNSRAAGSGRIKRIKVKDFHLSIGTAAVPTSAFGGTPYGAWVHSADYVDINGEIEFLTDSTAANGFRLARVENALRPKIALDCPNLPKSGGFHFLNCTRPRLHDSDVVASSDTNAAMCILESCPGTELLDNNLLNQKSGLDVIEVGSGTTTSVKVRGGKYGHAAGATAGFGFNYGVLSRITGLELDADFGDAFAAVPAASSGLLGFQPKDSPGLSRAQFKVRQFDDFLGDVIADQWNSRVGSDPQVVAAAKLAGGNGLVRMVTGDDAAASMAVNGVQLESALDYVIWHSVVFEARVRLSAITNVALFLGWTDQVSALEMPFELGGSDALTSNASNAVGFLFDTGADTDNWHAVGVKADVDATKQNLAVAPVAATFETFRVEISTSTGTAVFYRNGAKIGSAMTNAITAVTAVTPYVGGFSRGAASRNIDIDYILCEQNR